MSNVISERVNTAESIDKIRSLNGQEMTDVISAGSSQRTPFLSEAVGWKIGAVTHPLPKLLELLRDLMRGLRQDPLRSSEEANGLTQGSSWAPNTRSDNYSRWKIEWSSIT